jgi:hypothetical protein
MALIIPPFCRHVKIGRLSTGTFCAIIVGRVAAVRAKLRMILQGENEDRDA